MATAFTGRAFRASPIIIVSPHLRGPPDAAGQRLSMVMEGAG
jgi:hypothetical protein